MTTVDLTADYHGHVIEYACDVDRAYFAGHLAVTVYRRRPIAHELCMNAPDGPCWSLDGYVIEVTAILPGVRVRRPVDEGAAILAEARRIFGEDAA